MAELKLIGLSAGSSRIVSRLAVDDHRPLSEIRSTWILSGCNWKGIPVAPTKSFFYNNLRFPMREDANDFSARLWATRRVGWLMETDSQQR